MSATPTTTTTTPGQPQRTCDQLGIFQGRTIPCLNCTRITQDADDDWSPDDVTCTPFEAMWYWVVVALVVAAVLAVVFGVPGYLLWGTP